MLRSTLISFPSIQLTTPDSDYAEISLFGPGIGECIVLHFGEGRWFIIDSCLNPDTKQPIALEYLRSIGVDVSNQVAGILITHWHCDHIEGAFTLLKACENAKLYHSFALSSDEALQMAALYKKDVFANTDKEIREFSSIIQFLFKTKARGRLDPVKAQHAFFDYRTGVQTRMIAMSPSNTSVTQAISNLVNIKPIDGSIRKRNIVKQSENLNAVAIHFTFGSFSAVLGSDLEVTDNNQTGWSAVFNSDIVGNLSLSTSSLFKVSHHGSETGHHDKIWSDLLVDKPLSITTAYTRSGLPNTDNINRVKALSSEFIVTRDSNAAKKIKREGMVEREMRAITKKRMSVNDRMGHVQIRVSPSGELNIAADSNCVRYV